MLDQIIRVVLWLHIAAGFTGFFVAPIALITRKGGNTHRKWGKVYFWAMTISVLSSLVVAAYRPNIFLFLIGIFSFYLAFTGYRVLRRKNPQRGQTAANLDWTVALITFVAGLFMIGRSFINMITASTELNVVLLLFGVLALAASGFDIWKFVRPSRAENAWVFDHLSRMIGSYIAAVSAFSVVNFSFLPPLARWLWPTLIGAPAIAIWIRYYRNKFARQQYRTTGKLSAIEELA